MYKRKFKKEIKMKKQKNNKKEKRTTAGISISTREKLKLLSAIRKKPISKLLDDFVTKELKIEQTN